MKTKKDVIEFSKELMVVKNKEKHDKYQTFIIQSDENDSPIHEKPIEIGSDKVFVIKNWGQPDILDLIKFVKEKWPNEEILDIKGPYLSIVFIGGPSKYKYLRDRVERELGIKAEEIGKVNPMTAVSEGAAIFAETIDWSSTVHNRKGSHAEAQTSDDLGLSFKYDRRTTDNQAKIGVKMKKNVSGYTFQICSADSGWDSGMLPLQNGKLLRVPLSKNGVKKMELYRNLADTTAVANAEMISLKIQKWSNDCI